MDREISSRLDNFEVKIDEINAKLEKSSLSSKRRWIYNLGFACVVASLTHLPFSIFTAVIIFLIGIALMLLSS